MKRNMFGNPQPASSDEIVEALEELGWDASQCSATIEHLPDEAPPFTGWCAEILGEEDTIGTVGYPSKEVLIADLKSAGITDISTP